jgi:hypothetical protein
VKRPLLRLAGLLLGLGALTALGACGHSVGDSCLLSTDCSAAGDRTCDLSQPGGYCTIEGCDDKSCPSEAICVRFFPIEFLSKPCTLDKAGDCDASEICICNPSGDNPRDTMMCDAGGAGLCAARDSERRLCVKSCKNNGDCRDGYVCRQGGAHGSVPLLTSPDDNSSFCAPSNG